MSSKKKAKAEKPVAEAVKVESTAPAKEKKGARLRGRARAEAVVTGPQSGKPATLSPGTKLQRQYKGRRITVVVMEGGKFEYSGKFYSSLSALANEITGSHVSGIAWFGLKARAQKARAKK